MLVLYPVAFVSGILTTLSPCVLPILPIILGSGLEGSKWRVRGVILGLVASFTFFALTLSLIVSSLGISADTLRLAAAAILVFFGVSLVVPKVWERVQCKLEEVFHPPKSAGKHEGFGGGLITGGVLGLVWTPCVGPVIATITTLAALESFSLGLILLMFTYAIGIGLPLFAIASGGSYVAGRISWYKQNQGRVRKWFGVIVIVTAVLIGSGAERGFQTWVLDNLPESIANPVGLFEEGLGIEGELKELKQ